MFHDRFVSRFFEESRTPSWLLSTSTNCHFKDPASPVKNLLRYDLLSLKLSQESLAWTFLDTHFAQNLFQLRSCCGWLLSLHYANKDCPSKYVAAFPHVDPFLTSQGFRIIYASLFISPQKKQLDEELESIRRSTESLKTHIDAESEKHLDSQKELSKVQDANLTTNTIKLSLENEMESLQAAIVSLHLKIER